MEYFFRSQSETDYHPRRNTVKFVGENLSDIVSEFRDFLVGCGYSADLVDGFVPCPYRDWKYTDEIDSSMEDDSEGSPK